MRTGRSPVIYARCSAWAVNRRIALLLAMLLSGCGTGVAQSSSSDGDTAKNGANGNDSGVNNGGSGGGQGSDGQGDGSEVAGDPTNSGCISDRVEVPSGEHCACQFDTCDAASLDCTCDVGCYGTETCLVNSDSSGNASTADSFLGGCNLSCTPEDDLSTELYCSASDCEVQPNSTAISPAAAPSAPATTSFEAERQATAVDVLFVVDNSQSMTDNQVAAACAMDSFVGTVAAGGGSFNAGVLTTDILGDGNNGTSLGQTYDPYSGAFVGPPTLVQLNGYCGATTTCNTYDCNGGSNNICDFTDGGGMVSSDAPNASQQLEQLVVQGDQGSAKEGGLEQAFQYFAAQERTGTFDYSTQKEIVVLSDEDAAAYYPNNGEEPWLCPFDKVDRQLYSIPNFSMPISGPYTDASCVQNLIDFYTYYFTSRHIIVHGLLYDSTCQSASTEKTGVIYQAVIEATGGHVSSICHCDTFNSFFTDVGQSTSTLSTEMCFQGAMPDASTIQVTYLEGGSEQLVPQSAADGWTLDTNLNCIVMHGSWKDANGTYRIDYVDPNAPPTQPSDPSACMAPGVDPLLDTIQVICNGQSVPNSSSDGYTFDPVTDCFTFHGSWTSVDGSTCTVEYL